MIDIKAQVIPETTKHLDRNGKEYPGTGIILDYKSNGKELVAYIIWNKEDPEDLKRIPEIIVHHLNNFVSYINDPDA